jgi:probable HAF family extracellular repeat protein
MNVMIRSIHSTLGKTLVLSAFALSLLVTAAVTFADQESGGSEHQKRQHNDDRDVGLKGRGFVANNGVFTTIDAPDAGLYTVAFGIDESGKTVGGYVDDRGRLHGFLEDKEAFTVIDFPGAAATFVSRINAQGQIVGAYSDDPNAPALELSHGFLFDNGAFTKIDFPGAVRTQPFGLNNLGQIVGEYVDTEGRSHGFLLAQGAYITIDAPGGRSTVATDIDDSGQIVGFSATVSSGGVRTVRGFLRGAQGDFSSIDVPNAAGTLPRAINNRGQIVGEYAGNAAPDRHGFLLDEGGYTTIDAPDARGGTRVFDIDDGGRVAGAYDLPQHGYVRERRGHVRTFDHPDAGRTTEGIGINTRDQIVGHYFDVDDRFHGFLLDKQGFTALDVPGATGTDAYRINDRGQVVGFYVDANGVTHGFLWEAGIFTTIDVPGAVFTQAADIDSDGLIVGSYLDAAGAGHGFRREMNGAFTTIDVPGATSTGILGTNDRGQIVGVYIDAGGILHAFLLDNGAVTVIDVPNAGTTAPADINNRGQIVGGYFDDVRRHAFLLSDGVFTTLTIPGAFEDSIAVGINDEGQIVGLSF